MTDETIFPLLVPSLVGIAMCMVCLTGLTLAWFSATVSSGPQTITTSSFRLADIRVARDEDPVPEEAEATPQPYLKEPNTVVFDKTGTYTVMLTTEGGGNGYFRIHGSGFAYYKQVPAGENTTVLTFTVEALEGDGTELLQTVEYSFEAVWGTTSMTGAYNAWPAQGGVTIKAEVLAPAAPDEDETQPEDGDPTEDDLPAEDGPGDPSEDDLPAEGGPGDPSEDDLPAEDGPGDPTEGNPAPTAAPTPAQDTPDPDAPVPDPEQEP